MFGASATEAPLGTWKLLKRHNNLFLYFLGLVFK